jgi:hypothetical protein
MITPQINQRFDTIHATNTYCFITHIVLKWHILFLQKGSVLDFAKKIKLFLVRPHFQDHNNFYMKNLFFLVFLRELS